MTNLNKYNQSQYNPMMQQKSTSTKEKLTKQQIPQKNILTYSSQDKYSTKNIINKYGKFKLEKHSDYTSITINYMGSLINKLQNKFKDNPELLKFAKEYMEGKFLANLVNLEKDKNGNTIYRFKEITKTDKMSQKELEEFNKIFTDITIIANSYILDCQISEIITDDSGFSAIVLKDFEENIRIITSCTNSESKKDIKAIASTIIKNIFPKDLIESLLLNFSNNLKDTDFEGITTKEYENQVNAEKALIEKYANQGYNIDLNGFSLGGGITLSAYAKLNEKTQKKINSITVYNPLLIDIDESLVANSNGKIKIFATDMDPIAKFHNWENPEKYIITIPSKENTEAPTINNVLKDLQLYISEETSGHAISAIDSEAFDEYGNLKQSKQLKYISLWTLYNIKNKIPEEDINLYMITNLNPLSLITYLLIRDVKKEDILTKLNLNEIPDNILIYLKKTLINNANEINDELIHKMVIDSITLYLEDITNPTFAEIIKRKLSIAISKDVTYDLFLTILNGKMEAAIDKALQLLKDNEIQLKIIQAIFTPSWFIPQKRNNMIDYLYSISSIGTGGSGFFPLCLYSYSKIEKKDFYIVLDILETLGYEEKNSGLTYEQYKQNVDNGKYFQYMSKTQSTSSDDIIKKILCIYDYDIKLVEGIDEYDQNSYSTINNMGKNWVSVYNLAYPNCDTKSRDYYEDIEHYCRYIFYLESVGYKIKKTDKNIFIYDTNDNEINRYNKDKEGSKQFLESIEYKVYKNQFPDYDVLKKQIDELYSKYQAGNITAEVCKEEIIKLTYNKIPQIHYNMSLEQYKNKISNSITIVDQKTLGDQLAEAYFYEMIDKYS